MERKLAARQAAQKAFAEVNNSVALRRAMRARTRTQRSFHPGEVVFVWRSWRSRQGPGVVVLPEDPNVYVNVKGKIWKVHVRAGTSEEMRGMEAVREAYRDTSGKTAAASWTTPKTRYLLNTNEGAGTSKCKLATTRRPQTENFGAGASTTSTCPRSTSRGRTSRDPSPGGDRAAAPGNDSRNNWRARSGGSARRSRSGLGRAVSSAAASSRQGRLLDGLPSQPAAAAAQAARRAREQYRPVRGQEEAARARPCQRGPRRKRSLPLRRSSLCLPEKHFLGNRSGIIGSFSETRAS